MIVVLAPFRTQIQREKKKRERKKREEREKREKRVRIVRGVYHFLDQVYPSLREFALWKNFSSFYNRFAKPKYRGNVSLGTQSSPVLHNNA